MKEIINSIKLNLYNKAVSPLFGYYAISWVGWNYKLIFVLFSSLEVKKKFEYIDTNIFTGEYYLYLLPLFVYPFIAAIGAIFILPYPAEWVYKFHKKKQEDLLKIKQNLEKNVLLTKEESIEIRRKIKKLEDEHSIDVTEKNQEIADLKLEIKDLTTTFQKNIDGKNSTINEVKKQLAESVKNVKELQQQIESNSTQELVGINEDEAQILLLFNKNRYINPTDLRHQVKRVLNINSDIKYEQLLNNIKQKELIFYNYQKKIYYLTSKARDLMVKNNLVD